VYFVQIYVSTNTDVSVLFLREICFLICSVDQERADLKCLCFIIYTWKEWLRILRGQLDNSRLHISKD
jgi:hypothetical protein